MSIKILVTGANGQLGKTLHDLYQKNNDNLDLHFVTKSELDISSREVLSDYFQNHAFDYCINCAAYTNVEQAEESIEDAFKTNAEAVGFLAESCNKSNTKLIHVSTDYVFDGTKDTPYLETDQTNPINAYGRSKLAGERLIQESLDQFFIIRTSWLYSKYPKNFVTTIASKIQEDANLSITTSQKGTPTSCVELSKFIYFLIKTENKNFGIYHFSAKGEATWYDFALKIADHFPNYDKSKIIATDSFKSKAERPNYSVMSNDKTQKIYKVQNNWKSDADNVLNDVLENN
ncbi:MAG: dTDP-4-dehydrorhamnose reductase [Aquaticitalea sp.]